MPLKFLALLLLVAGCARSPHPSSEWFQEGGKLRVLSTTSMIHDLVQQIGGEDVCSLPLIRGELDPHSYELVKGDDEKFACASLIFYNGLGLEHGLSLRQNLENNPRAVAVTQAIVERKPAAVILADGQYDPHIWMDIALWMETIDPIVAALSEKDPDHAPLYRERGEALRAKMAQADREAFARLQAIPSERRYLVTSHDAFNYFTRHYLADPGESEWEVRCEAPEGLAPEAQMSITHLLAVISHVEKYRITVLFPESNVNQDALKKILLAAKERGCEVRLSSQTLYGDSMGDAPSYIEMIRHNVEAIAEELER